MVLYDHVCTGKTKNKEKVFCHARDWSKHVTSQLRVVIVLVPRVEARALPCRETITLWLNLTTNNRRIETKQRLMTTFTRVFQPIPSRRN